MLEENSVRTISASMQEPQWFLDKRIESFKEYSSKDTPLFKYGIGIFADISKLDISKINPLDNNNEHSIDTPDQVEIIKFSKAYKRYGDLIKKYFSDNLKEDNKLNSLHKAFFNNGIVIRIPRGFKSDRPIYITSKLVSKTSIENLLIFAEEDSKAVIIETLKSDSKSEQSFRSQIIQAEIKPNANIEFISIQDLEKSVYNFSKRNANVDSKGFIYWVDCGIGSKFTQTRTLTNLGGENAESKSWGIVFGDKDQCYDIDSITNHTHSNTISDMLTRVVLNKNAKAIYRGLVKINPGALNCEGYQKDDTILLSDESKADVVPNLEISNNDVKCSHGATISQIDEDKLFYMMSRGLDEETAKKSIVQGFFDPVIVKIQNEDLKEEIINSISKRLEVVH
jgi:Fe-S cluster assembly protein SufD